MSFDLRPRESVVKQSAGREESFVQLPFCVFFLRVYKSYAFSICKSLQVFKGY